MSALTQSPQNCIMIERILLGVLCLSGWHMSTCLPRQYHYVADAKTWTEAQTYCRQTYTDLATIENTEEVNQVIDTLSSAGYSSEVWIGAYNEIDWKWSDGFTESGTVYRNWAANDPNFKGAFELCGGIERNFGWIGVSCVSISQFVCYNGTELDHKFVFVNQYKNWSDAQSYCRKNFVDLATVRNDIEDRKVRSVLQVDGWVWIGLIRNPNFFWSDGSSFLFSNWDNVDNLIGSVRVICAVTSLQRSGKWKFFFCETRLPFVCYSTPVQKQVLKVTISPNPSVALNDPALRAELLKEFQNRLMEKGVSGVTLKWREQPDGQVFHKEEKTSLEEKKKEI